MTMILGENKSIVIVFVWFHSGNNDDDDNGAKE